jgi:hypothetical protein
VPRRASAQAPPRPSCRGWAQPPRRGAPLPRLASVRSTGSRGPSTRWTRGGAPAKRGPAATPRRASAWSAPRTGGGRRWPPRASGGWRSRAPAARWRWRRVWGSRGPSGWRQAGGSRCLTAGLQDAATALLPHVGPWRPPAWRQDNAPLRQPRWRPRPAGRSAQGGQSYRRRRLVGVQPRVVFGPQRAIAQLVAPCGGTIHTALVERLHLASRQRLAASGRRVQTLGQGATGGREQLALLPGSPNCGWPPASRRQRVLRPAATNGCGAAHRWRPCTPALAAGVTEPGGARQAGRLSRGPPWPQAPARERVREEEERAVAPPRSVDKPARRDAQEAANLFRGWLTG